jgi:hypothetical protein
MVNMKALLADLKNCFIKLDTIHGLIWIPGGVLGLFATFYALQHVIQIAAVIGFSYAVIEGLRKLLGNPIKAAIAKDLAKAEHWLQSTLGFDPSGVTDPSLLAGTTAVTPAAPVTPPAPVAGS